MKSCKGILTIIVTASVMSGWCGHNAGAAAVNGSIGMDGGGSATTSGSMHTLTFNNPMTTFVRTGDFNGVPLGQPVKFAPMSWFGSGNNAFLTSNNSPEWTINFAGTAYQYSIISVINAVIAQGGVSIVGEGVITISGAITRDPTYM